MPKKGNRQELAGFDLTQKGQFLKITKFEESNL
jgi:hypothetical protein